MLSLLIDEHISPVVAEQVQARNPGIIQSVHHWREGNFCGTADALLLLAAHEERLTLLTYDQKTIPPILVEFAATGQSHSGVVFVDQNTIASNDYGGLVRAILAFHALCQDW